MVTYIKHKICDSICKVYNYNVYKSGALHFLLSKIMNKCFSVPIG